MEVDPGPPFPHDEEEEPERRVPARTPPPPKKPLAEFLAEFERRLVDHPDQPATDSHLELEARADGARRPPMRSRRPPATLPEVPPGEEAPLDNGEPQEGDPAEPPAGAEAIGQSTGAGADPAPPAVAGPRQRLRGRRHRRRRH